MRYHVLLANEAAEPEKFPDLKRAVNFCRSIKSHGYRAYVKDAKTGEIVYHNYPTYTQATWT